jgi:peptidoglycan DL-endopeptidase CwlO
VSSMPYRRHVPQRSFRLTNGPLGGGGRSGARRLRGGWRACAVLAGSVAVCAAMLTGASAPASASSARASSNPTLNQLIAKANALSQQIDNLSQEYDGLQIQYSQAQADVQLARDDAARDARILGADQAYIDDIAVEGYMTGGMNPSLELLQTSAPQTMLDRASIMAELAQENGAKVNVVASAETAAERATAAADQEAARAAKVKQAMAAMRDKIQAEENVYNSQAFAQATQIFEDTGHYPYINPSGDSLGVQALRFALKMIGEPYVWGGASPAVGFDCSGLVVWAYAQVGITLEHFTGDLWNEVEHIPYSEVQPGDLVFFYADISHVGIYVGNGLMVDAPTFGQDVQIQPVDEDPLVGVGEVPG